MGYNEADTRAKLINLNLHEAGWSEDLIRREITAGTVEIINGKTIRKKGRMDLTDGKVYNGLKHVLNPWIFVFTQFRFG
jgi:type I site-specific restriction endonuclease